MTIGVVKVGSFANNFINLLIVSAVAYFIFFKALHLDTLDKKK